MTEAPKPRRRQWSESTRATLLEAGARAFAEQGFDQLTEDGVARTVGLTRGALQYQFGDKRGLFAEVFARMLSDLVLLVSDQTMEKAHSVAEVGAGMELFFALATQPARRRVLLVDGPAVLGWDQWRIALRTAFAPLLHHALGHWAQAGLIGKNEIPGHAELILGASVHAALADDAGDPAPKQALQAMLRRLSAG